jgi:hypothetical protein
MDESTLVPHAGFVETQAFCSKLVAALTELDPTGLASGLTA